MFLWTNGATRTNSKTNDFSITIFYIFSPSMTHTVHCVYLDFSVRTHRVCRTEFCARQRVFYRVRQIQFIFRIQLSIKPLWPVVKKIIIIKEIYPDRVHAIKWNSLIFLKVRLVVIVVFDFFSLLSRLTKQMIINTNARDRHTLRFFHNRLILRFVKFPYYVINFIF